MDLRSGGTWLLGDLVFMLWAVGSFFSKEECALMSNNKIMLIGLDPSVANYEKWPGLTVEKLEAVLRKDEAKLTDPGYDVTICFIDHGETAETTITTKL